MVKRMIRRIGYILIIVSLIFSLITFSFSWFDNKMESNISEFRLNVEDLEGIEISKDGYHFSSSLDLPTSAKLKCITTGANNFYYPLFNKIKSGNKYVSNLIGLNYIDIEEARNYYFYHDFYLKSVVDQYIYFDFDRFNIDLTHIINSSGYDSSFLKGALRVGLFQYNYDLETFEKKLVIFPFANYELNGSYLNFNGNIEDKYLFYNNNNINSVYYVNTNNNGYCNIDDCYYIWDYENLGSQAFGYLNNNINEFRIVIWLEGIDRECENILANDTSNELYLDVSMYFTTG